MSVTTKAVYESAALAAAETTLYTSTGLRTIIDKVTVYCTNVCDVTIKLVPSGGTAATANIMEKKTLAVGDTYTFPGIVGHTLEPGDFISVLSSAAPGGNIRISGRVVT